MAGQGGRVGVMSLPMSLGDDLHQCEYIYMTWNAMVQFRRNRRKGDDQGEYHMCLSEA